MSAISTFKDRALVVLKAAPARLIAYGAIAATIIQQVSTHLPTGWQDNAGQIAGTIAAFVASAVAIIRSVTPVLESDKGLLPPDRPANIWDEAPY